MPRALRSYRDARSMSGRPTTRQVLDELAALLARVATAAGRAASSRAMSCIRPSCSTRSPRALPPEDVQLFYQTAILGRRDLHLAPDPRMGFEMTLVRMLAFRPAAEAGAGADGASTAPRSQALLVARRHDAVHRRHAAPRAVRCGARSQGGGRAPTRPGPTSSLRWTCRHSRASSPITACCWDARARWCAWRSIRAIRCCARSAGREARPGAVAPFRRARAARVRASSPRRPARRRRRPSSALARRSWTRRGARSKSDPARAHCASASAPR